MRAHISAMKLRVTKGRIACLLFLAPIFYALNSGPLVFCTYRFDLPVAIWSTLYGPLNDALEGTPLYGPYVAYEHWWHDLAVQSLFRARTEGSIF